VSLTAGHRLGPYQIVAPLGAGGMGEVYRARDTRLDREVAVKAENVLVTRDGRIKVLDFGLATQRPTPTTGLTESPTVSRFTDPGVVLGTVGYMSPEQVRGGRADHRTDIFALGIVLYEMLTGQRAFARETAAETMTAILKEDVPSRPRPAGSP
jgi:serine/threonine protein kinase